jgi:hypothetical protein
MLHLLPDEQPEPAPAPYAEAVARLASIRHALRLVDPFGGGPAGDVEDSAIASAWEASGAAKRRCFDARTGRVVASTAAGLEALLAERQASRQPNEVASQRLAKEIRRGLDDVSRLMVGTSRPANPLNDPYPLAL